MLNRLKMVCKKISLSLVFVFTFYVVSFPLFAQNAQNQVIIPRQIFVGDTGELKITFSAPIDFFRIGESDGEIDENVRGSGNGKGQSGSRGGSEAVELSAQDFLRAINETEYTIKKITLARNGKEASQQANQYGYVFSVIFTPWKTGEIKLPPYNLGNAFSLDNDFIITPSPIPVDSILTQKNIDSNFVPSKGPVLIPGTTYKIYFKIILLIIMLIFVIRIFVKWNEVNLFFKGVKLRLAYRRNRKAAIKNLNKLKSSTKPDRNVSAQIQSVMRNYLQVRFDYPFTKSATNELMKGFDEVFSGLLSDKKADAVEELTGIFVRTDYVRYGKEGQFKVNEKITLVDSLVNIIETLEDTRENTDD